MCRKIASLRIHVERCIGRIKNCSILTGTMPISMVHLSNQIVCICDYLSNFQPALVSPPSDSTDSSVEEYFQMLSDTDDGYAADSDGNDQFYFNTLSTSTCITRKLQKLIIYLLLG